MLNAVLNNTCSAATQVFSIVYSPLDGNMVASGSFDGTINVYNMSSGESIVLLGHADQVNHLAWSPTDPRELASSSRDRTSRIWRLATSGPTGEGLQLESMNTFSHEGKVGGVSYSPEDANRLAFGYLDDTHPVTVWDIFRWTTKQWRETLTDLVTVGDTEITDADLVEWTLPLDLLDL